VNLQSRNIFSLLPPNIGSIATSPTFSLLSLSLSHTHTHTHTHIYTQQIQTQENGRGLVVLVYVGVVCVKRGPLSLVSRIEELLERKVAASV
jgi:hypothetical protein